MIQLDVNDPDIEGERPPAEVMYETDGVTVQLWKQVGGWCVSEWREGQGAAGRLFDEWDAAFMHLLALAAEYDTKEKPHRTVTGP